MRQRTGRGDVEDQEAKLIELDLGAMNSTLPLAIGLAWQWQRAKQRRLKRLGEAAVSGSRRQVGFYHDGETTCGRNRRSEDSEGTRIAGRKARVGMLVGEP